MLNKFALLLIITFTLISSVYAANYYVDNTSGNDSNSGTSESQAWKSISKVNSKNFEPGDQILFKRGGVWYETLLINSDGAAHNPILYSAYGAGELPVIDGSFARESGIYAHSRSDIIISNFSLLNHIGEGAIRIMYGQDIETSDNLIYVTGHAGVFVENSSNIVVSKNIINTPSGIFEKQTDGIYSQRNLDNLYEKNHITISNSHPTEHLDGIQSFIDENLTIRDNLIIQNNSKDNSQGIYTTAGKGIHRYYNNVIDCPNTVAAVVGFRNMETGTAALRLYHNTLIGKGANVFSVSELSDLEAKNNIFIARSSNHSIVNYGSPVPADNINFNLYYNGGNPKVVVYQGVKKTLEEWKAYGYDNNSFIADPDLEPDYTLNGYSEALNAGIDAGDVYRFDKKGTIRPQQNGYDLGAYESPGTISSGTESIVGAPDEFQLHQNHPNPFNPSTQIRFSLPREAVVELKVYDILGNEIALLLNESKPSGEYNIEFDGSRLASGVYIYQLRADNLVQTRKMTLIK